MSSSDGDKVAAIDTIEEFLAHALNLESEVAERYEEIADSMEIHNNTEVAQLFRKLARASAKHAGEMRERAAGKVLPKIAPWDFQWGDASAPETPSMDKTHYLMTPYQALDMARNAEIQAQNYYTSVADNTSNADVRKLGLEFAYEEAEHVDLVNNLIARYPKPEKGWDFDPDPPSIPE
ncbi:MAG: ferritin family protein [Rhodospirillales bacterium]|nr:ferritin family protein [Rhodospirillales bacterium]